MEDVIQKGVNEFLGKIEAFKIKRSILHWDVRATLTGERKELALAFRDCFQESETHDVSVDQLHKKLGWSKKSKISSILNEFVTLNYIDIQRRGDKSYYHAD